MTKVCGTRGAKTTYGKLKTGDCFFDDNNLFCIKIDDSSCLYFKNNVWKLFEECTIYDGIFPVNVEIHIIS